MVHCVFDEADRLFEMGYAVQIRNIMLTVSKKRQTMLFSATIPASLADFSRACLVNPIMIRLDTDIKISENLQLSYIYVRNSDDKLGALMFILREIMLQTYNNMIPSILIFAATRYHVELISELLKINEINNVCCYGSLEHKFRSMNINQFRKKEVPIMVVTDVAARGIDIPLLDFVINFQMPNTVKNFIHRVGRVARAGRYIHITLLSFFLILFYFLFFFYIRKFAKKYTLCVYNM